MARSVFMDPAVSSNICQETLALFSDFSGATQGAPYRLIQLIESIHQLSLNNQTNATVRVVLTAPGRAVDNVLPTAKLVTIAPLNNFTFDGTVLENLQFPAGSTFWIYADTVPTSGYFQLFSTGV